MIYLGIDCGTQGTKAILYDSDKYKIISKGYASHSIILGESGVREQKADWWISALEASVKMAIENAGISGLEIKAMSVSGQQHGLVVLDKAGKVLRNVKLWNDTSTAPYNAKLISDLGGLKEVWKYISTNLPVGYTASKLLYLINQEPEIYKNTCHVLLPHDYLNYYLSGNYATDSSEACGTGYYDVLNRKYSKEMMDAIDPSNRLSSLVPPVVDWVSPIGLIRPEVADRLGLSREVLVAAGGGDNSMGSIGTASINPGRLTLSLGTSGTVSVASMKMGSQIDPLLQIYEICKDRWLITGCTLNATSATTSLKTLFGLSINELDLAMESSPIGAEGVVSIPFYDGERMPPIPHATGFFKNLTSINLNKENLIRATAESVVFTLKWGYDKIREAFGEVNELVLTGGGSNSYPWRIIIAEVFGMPVHCLAVDEGGALGAALQAQFMYQHETGISNQSLSEICNACTSFVPEKDVIPKQENIDKYKKYFTQYKECIEKEWGVTL